MNLSSTQAEGGGAENPVLSATFEIYGYAPRTILR
jgi:hypothetical protein